MHYLHSFRTISVEHRRKGAVNHLRPQGLGEIVGLEFPLWPVLLIVTWDPMGPR